MRPLGLAALIALGALPARAQVATCGDAGAPPCAAEAQRRALVIGVSRYPRLDASKQLRYADADARAFSTFLTANDGARLPAPNVRLLVNDSATVPIILRELRTLLRDSKAGDVAIVYFAGHGTEEDGEAPRRAFLLASDAARQSELDVGGIEFSQLQSWLEKFVQKNVRVILVTDACRSGGMAVNEGYTRGAATALQRRFNGVTQLLSSDGDELSIEGDEWGNARFGKGHGVYTYFLLEGWRGFAADTATGVVTLRSLQDFVRDRVRKATSDKQSPQHTGSLRDTLLTIPATTLASLRRDGGTGGPPSSNAVVASAAGTRDAGASNVRALDSTTRALVARLRDAIVSGRLTTPADSSAVTAYRRLAARRAARAILPRLVDELVAAMQEDADRLIHRYLEGGNDQPRPAAYRDAGALLDHAVALLPPNDPSRRTMIARRDFLFGFAIVRENDRPRFLEGERLLRHAIALEPRAAYAWNALGLLHSARGEQEAAERAYRAAMAKAPRWQYPVNNLAVVYQERRDYARALSTFRGAIALDTLGAGAYNNLGNVYSSLGRYDLARRNYQRASEVHPDLAMSRGNLASLYRMTGRRPLAHAYLDSAFALLRHDAKGDSLWMMLEAGRLALDELDAVEADSIFVRASKSAPARPEPYYYRGEAQRSLGNRTEAERLYRQAVARDPRYASAYNGLSLLYRSGPGADYVRALAVLDDAARALPASPDIPYFRGWLAQDRMLDTTRSASERAAAFGQAVEEFERTLKRDSLYGSAYSSLGEVYEARDRWDDAERAYRRGVLVSDSSADVRFALAEHYGRRALRDASQGNRWRSMQRQVLRDLIVLDPQYAAAFGALAQSEIDDEDFSAAATHLRSSAALGFTNASLSASARALHLRGTAIERSGRLEVALRAYESALALDSAFIDAKVARARALYLMGSAAQAAVAVDELLPNARDDEERRQLSHLRARVLLDLARPQEALDATTHALPRDSTFTSAELHLTRALALNALLTSLPDAAAGATLRERLSRELALFQKRAPSPADRVRALQSYSAITSRRAQAILDAEAGHS